MLITDVILHSQLFVFHRQKSKREVRSSEAGYLAGDIGLIPRPNLTPSLLALVHLQKRNGIDAATQTERLSEIKLPHSSLSSMRMVKSAAYRVLHETNCSSNYVDSFKYLPRNSNV